MVKHTSLLNLILMTGCYLPESEADSPVQRAQRHYPTVLSTAGSDGSSSCRGDGCAVTRRRTKRNSTDSTIAVVRVKTATAPMQAPLGVEITIPPVEDCSETSLTVVGAYRAAIGESLVLEAHSAGTDELPHVLWASETTELTVLGPATVEVTCITTGDQSVQVKLAQPSPCPSSVDFAIECVAPAAE